MSAPNQPRSCEGCFGGVTPPVTTSQQHSAHIGFRVMVVVLAVAAACKLCACRRRLELFGEDHNMRPGWVTVGKNISHSNFNRQVRRDASWREPVLQWLPHCSGLVLALVNWGQLGRAGMHAWLAHWNCHSAANPQSADTVALPCGCAACWCCRRTWTTSGTGTDLSTCRTTHGHQQMACQCWCPQQTSSNAYGPRARRRHTARSVPRCAARSLGVADLLVVSFFQGVQQVGSMGLCTVCNLLGCKLLQLVLQITGLRLKPIVPRASCTDQTVYCATKQSIRHLL